MIVDRVPPARPGVEFRRGDITDLVGALSDVVSGVETVFHLAWTTKPQSASEDPLHDLETNVSPGIRLLDHLRRLPTSPRVIFISSGGAVYGRTDADRINEDHPTAPLNAYGVTKLAFEHYLRLYRHLHDLDYLVYRPSNPYGEYQNPFGSQGAVAVFLGKIARGETITVWGNGSVVRDYLYVGDLADALVAGVDYTPAENGPRVFNVGSGLGLTVRDLVAAISRITGRGADVAYTSGRKTDPPRIVLDVSRAAEHLRWTATTDLETGVTRTWRWILENTKR